MKENIVYPPAFSGRTGENVFKFVKDFKDAISSDQVRKSDQVKTLLKYIKGSAKFTVGDHFKDLDSALKALEENHGNTALIWSNLKQDMEKKLGHFSKWGKVGTQMRLDAIHMCLDFLRNADTLAEDHPELVSDIYHISTVKFLKVILPNVYKDEFLKVCDASFTNKQVMQKLGNVLDDLRRKTQFDLSTEDEPGKDRRGNGYAPSSESSENKSIKSHSAGNTKFPRHNCHKSSECNTDWDMLGCVELYKLKKVEDRIKMLKESKSCIFCGAPYSQPKDNDNRNNKHFCRWNRGKYAAMCNGMHQTNKECRSGAAVCLKHPDNASSELKTWLAKQNLKFVVGVAMAGNIKVRKCDDVDFDEFTKFAKDIEGTVEQRLTKFKKIKDTTAQVGAGNPPRDKLQSGEASKMMNDDQLVEYFTEDMRRSKKEQVLHPIPPGEPVFIFSVFQGKKNAVTALIDSGANCWLAEDGIPQRELDSVKLDHGPIPIGVASGLVAYANAEWASLLPLEDGTSQIVRGLTLEKVTGKMPELNLVPVYEAIKAKCKDIPEVQNLKVPAVVGGDVHMIIGIKYLNIFPEHIHTLPNGLTIFKSKLKPTSAGTLACIGGPVECLQQLCGTAGSKVTMSYMSCLIQNLRNFKSRVDFFPSMQTNSSACLADYDIPDVMRCIAEEESIDTVIVEEENIDTVIMDEEKEEIIKEDSKVEENVLQGDEEDDCQDIDDFVNKLKTSRKNQEDEDFSLIDDDLAEKIKEFRKSLSKEKKTELENWKTEVEDWKKDAPTNTQQITEKNETV